jgi:hypothetical protein
MGVEGVSNDGATTTDQGAASYDDYSLTDADVLAFLSSLSVDRQRCHSLNSGPRLVSEAIETGLVEPDDVEPLISGMVELREHGLVGWTPAHHDTRGDDVLHAAEFHLTKWGRRHHYRENGSTENGST